MILGVEFSEFLLRHGLRRALPVFNQPLLEGGRNNPRLSIAQAVSKVLVNLSALTAVSDGSSRNYSC